MIQHRRFLIASLLLILCVGALSSAPMVRGAADTLPTRLDDKEFWRISEEFSEPNGFFRSDNLLSNEMGMQHVIPDLVHRTAPGGVYMGVGPEQNFTYIAVLKPKMVFITDIRRGNLHTQLMYKALFELSANRAEFVSRLFTKKRPDGLETSSPAQELFKAFSTIQTGDEAAYKENFKAIVDLLVKKHKLPLSDDDQAGIEYVYHSFYTFGPGISYNSTGRGFGGGRGGRGGNFTTYADLMTQTDSERREPWVSGQRREFQGAEESGGEEPHRSAGRRFWRAQGNPGSRQVPERARRDRDRVLSFQRRAISG